jgi:CRP/FNR family transcriptional regulator, nitrogen oxide reductase regulator
MSSVPSPARYPELKSRLFEGLAQRDVSAILGAATQQRLPSGTVIFRQGDPAGNLYILMHGRARHFYTTPEGQKMLLPWIVPGGVFGVAALLPESTSYLVSTETVIASSLLQWDSALIRGLAERHPRMLENAFAIAAAHMQWALDAHVGLLCHSARERLAQTLVNFAHNIGDNARDGVELDLTNEDLADAASVTRFTASRVMSEWHRQGILTKSRGKVLLRSPEKLFSL